MSSRHRINRNISLKGRNQFPDNIKKYVLTDTDELSIKYALDIENYSVMEKNSEANKLNWYGARLNILKNFYCKTNVELSIAVGVSDTYISNFIDNKKVPPKNILDKFCFLFEVPVQFFTDREITIKLNEQFKLTML